MLTKLKNLLSSLLSTKGELSMVRFLSLICVVTACVLAFIGMFVNTHTLESVAILCGTFLGAGLGAKVLQKPMESKLDTVVLSTNVSKSNNEGESGELEDKK